MLWELHDDDALQKIDRAAIRLLTNTGMRIDHQGLLDLMSTAGCEIDSSRMRCRFNESLVRDAVAHFLTNPTAEIAIPSGWSPQYALAHSGSFPHLLEWPSGRRGLATTGDVSDMAKMAHTLDEFTSVGKVLTCSEIDQRIEPLWSAVRLAEITNKRIGGGEVFEAGQIEPLVRMGEALTGESGGGSLIASCDFFISPLAFDRKQAECFLEKRRFGLPIVPGTMPISGMSAPVTLAGTVAVAVAELLAGWTFGYVVAPTLPAGGIVSSGSMDLRTVSASFGSPEAILQDLATVQVCRRLYGIKVSAAVGYVDCKRPGIEATFQKMLPLAASPMGIGAEPGGGGLLSAGQDYSPVQHLLDTEISGAVKRLRGHFEVNESTLAIDLTERIASAGDTDFLQTAHTLENFRTEQWYPKWFDRTLWQGSEYEDEAEVEMLRRIDAYTKDAIQRYEEPDIDQARLREMRGILAVFEKRPIG